VALSWWGWYEFIRSPYLTHGYMTLHLQFRLRAEMTLPTDEKDVQLDVREGGRYSNSYLNGDAWRGHDGNRPGILATALLAYKTYTRTVTLELPGLTAETWTLDLSADPDPTPGFTEWRSSSPGSKSGIEMSFSLE
jgi:hypothetical protein